MPAWDTPGLPPTETRCQWHSGLCAYRDDDPARCTLCHASPAKCTCDDGPFNLTRINAIRASFTAGATAKSIAAETRMNTRRVTRILRGLYDHKAEEQP